MAVLPGVAATEQPPKADLVPYTHSPDLFPILSWDKVHDPSKPLRSAKNGIQSIAECNFTVAGFVRPEDLPQCEKLGLAAILAPSQNWKKLRDDEIDGRVKQMVEATAKSRTVLGYFIMDEPGVTSFPMLGKIVAAVKKYAPGKLVYINLFPSYATVGAPDRSQLGTANYTEYWWFGCYGKPSVLLKTDESFKLVGKYTFDCALGIVGLADGGFLVARGRSLPGKKYTASLFVADADAKKGLVIRSGQQQ